MRLEPQERIDKRALTVWRLTGGIWSLVLVLVGVGVCQVILQARPPFAGIIVTLVGVLLLLLCLLNLVVKPMFRWRWWRYEVSDKEIYLQHGIFVIHRTLIPMSRVQHVDTQQGPLLRRYGLANVTVATAAGTHEIPALTVYAADRLRDKIADLAGVADDV